MRNKKNSQTPNKKNIFGILALVLAVVGASAQGLSVWMCAASVRLPLFVSAVVPYVGAAWLWRIRQKAVRNPKDRIIAVIRDAGFECGVNEDDDIVIKIGNVPLLAHVVQLPEDGRQRVHFSTLVEIDEMQVSEQGINYMISQMNSHNDYFTMRLREDGVECRVETVVDRAKDVLREMDFALGQIGRAVRVIERNMKAVAEKYPARSNERHKVGFVVPACLAASDSEG